MIDQNEVMSGTPPQIWKKGSHYLRITPGSWRAMVEGQARESAMYQERILNLARQVYKLNWMMEHIAPDNYSPRVESAQMESIEDVEAAWKAR